jgi:hypothetical protein
VISPNDVFGPSQHRRLLAAVDPFCDHILCLSKPTTGKWRYFPKGARRRSSSKKFKSSTKVWSHLAACGASTGVTTIGGRNRATSNLARASDFCRTEVAMSPQSRIGQYELIEEIGRGAMGVERCARAVAID